MARLAPGYHEAMTNGLALALALAVAALFALDAYLGFGGALFLTREGLGLINWLAFWR